jgi:hypothetical protein
MICHAPLPCTLLYCVENKFQISPGGDILKKMKIGILFVLAALLLVSVVSADTISGTMIYPSNSGNYFDVSLADGTKAPLWCVELHKDINVGSYQFERYSSLDPSIPVGTTVPWDLINYLCNHHDATHWKEYQLAIWYFIDPTQTPAVVNAYLNGRGDHTFDSYDTGVYNALIADTIANGDGFTPGPGDCYAVVLYVTSTTQMVFYCAQVPTTAPEFPTLALPMGMLIGVVGAVYVVKGREK